MAESFQFDDVPMDDDDNGCCEWALWTCLKLVLLIGVVAAASPVLFGLAPPSVLLALAVGALVLYLVYSSSDETRERVKAALPTTCVVRCVVLCDDELHKRKCRPPVLIAALVACAWCPLPHRRAATALQRPLDDDERGGGPG
jgi:hypothetical protein